MSFAAHCGRDDAARRAAVADVLEQLSQRGVHTLRIAWPDLHGTLRGKSLVVTPARVRQALDDGIGLVSTLALKDSADRTAFAIFDPAVRAAEPALAGFGAAGNLVLLPDPASLKFLPWAPGTAWLRAEPFFADGTELPLCPRRALRHALASLREAGFTLRCGLELELHVFRIVDATPRFAQGAALAEPPALAHSHGGWKLLAEDLGDAAHEVLDTLRVTALGLDLPLASLEIELGPSQFEAVFDATEALEMADAMVLFRAAARQALRRCGWHASFACLPRAAGIEGTVASGWHLHQSLATPEGLPAMAPRHGAEAPLSEAGCHWLAGLLAHARALTALCAPTAQAYSRYTGGPMTPPAAVWARDHRGAMLRVIGNGPGDPATRIENRLGEPLANPHLAIAAQVWAGLEGLARRLPLPPPCEAPYARAAAAVPSSPHAANTFELPATLGVALDALQACTPLRTGLGSGLLDTFVAIKRQELRRRAEAAEGEAFDRREVLARF